jgi:hypothetical protein
MASVTDLKRSRSNSVHIAEATGMSEDDLKKRERSGQKKKFEETSTNRPGETTHTRTLSRIHVYVYGRVSHVARMASSSSQPAGVICFMCENAIVASTEAHEPQQPQWMKVWVPCCAKHRHMRPFHHNCRIAWIAMTVTIAWH